MSKTCLCFSCFSVPLGLDFVGRHVTLELFACNGVPGKLLNLPLWTEAPLSWIWEPSGWSQDVLLGGISLIMGPRNPGGCYFWKKRPLPGMPRLSSELVSTKNQNSRNSDKKSTIFRKGTRGKMTPQVFSIQCQSPFLISSRNSFILEDIAKQIGVYIKNPLYIFTIFTIFPICPCSMGSKHPSTG